RQHVLGRVVESEPPGNPGARRASAWRDAEEIAAPAGVWFRGRVDDPDELDAFAVESDLAACPGCDLTKPVPLLAVATAWRGGAELVELGVEPRRADKRDALDPEGAQR